MGLYNFQKRFVRPILSRDKTHTIRAKRKHPDKPGNILHLYTGLRQKGARLLMRVPCTKVEEIKITATHVGGILYHVMHDVWIDDYPLDSSEKQALARRDGFKDFEDMMAFWEGRLPFVGDIIHWK